MARTAHPEDVFTAIAEPRRREVIAVLADGKEYAVNDIVLRMKMAQPAISKHLGALRKAGVVTVIKRGQQRIYRLEPVALKPVHEWVKVFERYWTHKIDQIKQSAERKALERMGRVDDTPDPGKPNPKKED
jgi:DNA-binding transcriptional ArsR family regulator